jgi:hypothetical protein
MSGQSNVGNSQVYEAGDQVQFHLSSPCHVCLLTARLQRNYKDSEVQDRLRYKEGQPNSHLVNDSSAFLHHNRNDERQGLTNT